jgi:hypothetical protein
MNYSYVTFIKKTALSHPHPRQQKKQQTTGSSLKPLLFQDGPTEVGDCLFDMFHNLEEGALFLLKTPLVRSFHMWHQMMPVDFRCCFVCCQLGNRFPSSRRFFVSETGILQGVPDMSGLSCPRRLPQKCPGIRQLDLRMETLLQVQGPFSKNVPVSMATSSPMLQRGTPNFTFQHLITAKQMVIF